MMQAVAILLVAVSVGANPWDTPQAAEQTAPGQPRVDTPWDGDATLADHQHQLDTAARRKTEPVAPAPMNSLQRRNPNRRFQPAANGQAVEANRNVILAQYVEGDAWPTAGTGQAAVPRDEGRNAVGDSPRAPQLAIPNYLDAQPAANQTDSYDGNLNTDDVTAEPREATKMAPTIPVTTDPNTNIRGGGTLLYLAFFASVGLNFYLGWITWDTYNRYQDMVSDIRHSNTSARRERVEQGRDLADRRKDRHLVDSAAY
jgi:hypothetical protein